MLAPHNIGDIDYIIRDFCRKYYRNIWGMSWLSDGSILGFAFGTRFLLDTNFVVKPMQNACVGNARPLELIGFFPGGI